MLQTRALSTMWYMKKVNPKLFVAQLMLRTYEHDKETSENLIDSIKTGEESHLNYAVQEDKLVSDTKILLEAISKEKDENEAAMKFRSFFGL